MALFSPEFFEPLFVPLAGKRIGFVPLNGNVGDHLNHQATRELFGHFEIDFRDAPPGELHSPELIAELDELVISGGGNIGSAFYRVPFKQRRIALGTGLPTTVFPQSFIGNEEDLSGYKRIFVREKRSLSMNERFELAPAMAMGLAHVPPLNKAREPLGVFLRRDQEAHFPHQRISLGDPAELSATWQEYLELAGAFDHVVTDRLHFAIAALLQNRGATLLPNSYWKNRAVFDTWLRDFECDWMDDPAALRFERDPVAKRMLHRLAAPPGKAIGWFERPVVEPGYRLYEHDGAPVIRRADGKLAARCNEYTQIVWALCDGGVTVADILDTLCELYPDDVLAVARDVQKTLASLVNIQAVRLIPADTETGRVEPEPALAGRSKRPARRVEVVVAPAVLKEDKVLRSAVVSGARCRSRSLWFEYHDDLAHLGDETADAFLLVALMGAMRAGRDLEVRNAPVSAGLLRHLERFQQVWSRWRGELARVDIHAEEVKEPAREKPQGALLAFSGGVDSCFTAWEQVRGAAGRHQEAAAGGLMIHGFDIPCDDGFDPVFARAADRARRVLDDIGLPLLIVKTNTKALAAGAWLDYHGLLLGAALHLFKPGYAAGVIPSTMPYEMMMPLGSNPVSDPLMSCAGFDIIHHGGYAGRMDKIAVVGRWEAAARGLRVCWRGSSPDRNCGRCTKCVLTHLGMWAHGYEAPCFDVPLGAELVESALGSGPLAPLDWLDVHSILSLAVQNALDAPWIPMLRYMLSVRRQVQ